MVSVEQLAELNLPTIEEYTRELMVTFYQATWNHYKPTVRGAHEYEPIDLFNTKRILVILAEELKQICVKKHSCNAICKSKQKPDQGP